MPNDRYLVLARKWRPQQFDDVIGQDHITRTLKNALGSGRIHHAFLFIGSRGIGKTTSARILAKALNCRNFDAPTPTPCGTCDNCTSIGNGTNIDVIEIDGASNNGVDDVREIRDNIRMVPSNGRYKVYIIDEVHQLSTAAFNALLKTLEEPPPHAVFILATTEAHKIPPTIISRCQRYDFRRVPIKDIIALLQTILKDEGITASEEALYAIARAAEGGIRDAESILDELITYCDKDIDFKDVFELLGLVDWQLLHDLTEAILEKNITGQLLIVEDVVASGKDLSQFVQDILRYFRNLLVCKSADAAALLHLPEEELETLRQHAAQFPLTHLIRMVEQFAELQSGFDSQLAQRMAVEALLIRISKVGVDVSLDTVLEKLLQLENGGEAHTATTPTGTSKGGPPPPDPPKAEVARPAATTSAQTARMTATEDNLAEIWEEVTREVVNSDFNLGVRLGPATPCDIDATTLVLRVPAESKESRAALERPETRRIIDEALLTVTTNLTTIRIESTRSPEKTDAPQQDHAQQPSYPSANPEAAREALEDPAIASIVDIFKGRITEVKLAGQEPVAKEQGEGEGI